MNLTRIWYIRNRSRKDKYLKPRTAAGAGDLEPPGAGDPGTPVAGDPGAPGEPGGDHKDHLQVLTHTPPGKGTEYSTQTLTLSLQPDVAC